MISVLAKDFRHGWAEREKCLYKNIDIKINESGEYSMGLFDKIKNQATGAVGSAVNNIDRGSSKSVSVTFASMPKTLSEFTAQPQAAMQAPFDTAALSCCGALRLSTQQGGVR